MVNIATSSIEAATTEDAIGSSPSLDHEVDPTVQVKKRWREKKRKTTRNGVRTHACIRTLELKSNALTTRPPWLSHRISPFT